MKKTPKSTMTAKPTSSNKTAPRQAASADAAAAALTTLAKAEQIGASTGPRAMPSLCQQYSSQWYHPLVQSGSAARQPLGRDALRAFAYEYYLRFLPFFKKQPEGSILPGVEIEFTSRMRQKLGLAYLFEHKIRLNLAYFAEDPSLLPYTLFHEMTHLWLYNCLLDPGHTQRFYNKMAEFESTGLPVDPDVHVHTRVSPEGKFVYTCPNCKNRWYLRDRLSYSIYCGHCYDREGVEYYAKRLKTLDRGEITATNSHNAA